MPDVMITVHGRDSVRVPPDLARVTLSVTRDGADRGAVVAHVSQIADGVTARFAGLERADSITTWSSDTVRVSSHRPWSNDGRQLEPVVEAAVDFSATFSDFVALGVQLSELVGLDGLTVHGIAWLLEEEHAASVLDGVRGAAVEDATRRAAVYARAVGLGDIRPLAIADGGMLDGDPVPRRPEDGPIMLRMDAAGSGAGAAGLSSAPQDIVVEVVVDARFSAS